jgi:bifunctional non-homologous end joining protein LigD
MLPTMRENQGVPSSDIRTRVGDRELNLSNLDKVLYPLTGYTKAEVVNYYVAIAPVLLPHIRDRVITRVRFPDGVDAASFYEKNAPNGTPDWVRTVRIGTSDGIINYVVADEEATVVWLANLAALEVHVPQWRLSGALPNGEGVIALPEAGMTIVDTARAALIVAARLADDGMIPVPQTSGSKGMQIYAAVQPCRSRDVWSYVKELGVSLRRAYPEFFVSTMSISQRAGRIYVDYNQDLAARNTIAPYSLRGRATPVVATPVTWEEVAGVRGPDDLRFSPEEVLNRVAEHEDLAVELLNESRPALPHQIKDL